MAMTNPTLPVLQLDWGKANSYVSTPIKFSQGDKGYAQPFILADSGKVQTGDTVDVKSLWFRSAKPDGQYIDISGGFSYDTSSQQFKYLYPDEVSQAPGTLYGYFYAKDAAGKIVASTQRWLIQVDPTYSNVEGSNSAVQSWLDINDKLVAALAAALSSRDRLDELANSGQGIIDAKIAQLTKSVQDWQTKTLADLTKALADKQATLDTLNANFKSAVDAVNSKLTSIGTDWAARLASYDTDASQQRAGIKTSADTALAKVAADAQAQRDALNTQFNGTFLAGLKADFDALKQQWTASLADLQAALSKAQGEQTDLDGRIKTAQTTLDAITAKIETIDPDAINAAILKAQQTADAAQTAATAAQGTANDAKTAAATAQTAADGAKADAKTANDGVTTINGKLGTVPAGSNVMAEIAKGGKVQSVNNTAPDSKGDVTIALPSVAGMVKSATINGGTKVTADASGNLPLTVPNPDLSPYDTATQAAVKVSQAKADAISAAKQETTNQVAASRNSTVWTGTQAQYDALTASQRSQYLILGVTM